MKIGYKNMKCGLIGEHLGHSFSPLIHGELADYSYELCEIPPSELEAFVKRGKLDAFNVTIPYKKDVIPFLDEISPEALAIGAVNTVVRGKDGKLRGYNTDYFGFNHMIDLLGAELAGKKAVVFGTGGASLTVCAALRDRGVGELAVIGIEDNNPQTLAKHSDAQIVVNATPVGMYPKNGIAPADLSLFPKCVGVLDVIFNPAKTALLLKAEELGIPYVNGLPMLVAQAAKAFEFFTGDQYESGCIETITSLIEEKTANVVLVGMPGCGKTTVGKKIAQILDRPFFDADAEFEKIMGIHPSVSILEEGEDRFRELEHTVIEELGKKSGCVIATGGGAVTRECNYAPLHQNGSIFFIERELKNLAKDGRPLSAKTPAEEMYAKRVSSYRRFADATVFSNEIVDDTLSAIISEFKRIHSGK
ncbi:MAG: AAA family ATPase [Clostridia bacterium]|nr:AAA family ATPase [Clostridia bacterium]